MWLTEKLAGTAKSFGYAKPIVEAAPSRCSYLATALDSAVDVADVSVPVAPFMSNRLDVSPLATDVDEMALPYVLGKYAQCFVGTVATTYTDGTFVYASRLCPTNFWFRTNSGTPGGNITLPISSTLTTNAFSLRLCAMLVLCLGNGVVALSLDLLLLKLSSMLDVLWQRLFLALPTCFQPHLLVP